MKKTLATITTDNYKTRVGRAYAEVQQKTGEFMRSVVAFGALLEEVANFLGESRGGAHDGEGLKTWLEENCPEVNYNTAKGYKQLAVKCIAMMGGGTQAIAALQGRDTVALPGHDEFIDVDSRIIEKREEIFSAADSRRKLEQMYFDFLGSTVKGKAGRPKGTNAAVPQRRISDVEAAHMIWGRVVTSLSKDRGALFSAAALLTVDDATAAKEEFTMLLGALDQRIKEG